MSSDNRALNLLTLLFEVWPQATPATAKQYLMDVTGQDIPEGKILEVKKIFGIDDTDLSQEMKDDIEIEVLRLLALYGVAGIARQKILTHIDEWLQEKYTTVPAMIILQQWVYEIIEVAKELNGPVEVRNLLVRKVEEAKKHAKGSNE